MKIIDKDKSSGLIWIERLAVLLDSKFTIPGTRIKYGLDPILGLLPIVGDLTSFAISGALLFFMARHGASRKVIILMIGNLIIDTILGAIPLIGNIFDFSYKANSRNIKLLKKHYEEGKYQGSGKGIILMVLVALIATMVIIIFTLSAIFTFLYNLILS